MIPNAHYGVSERTTDNRWLISSLRVDDPGREPELLRLREAQMLDRIPAVLKLLLIAAGPDLSVHYERDGQQYSVDELSQDILEQWVFPKLSSVRSGLP